MLREKTAFWRIGGWGDTTELLPTPCEEGDAVNCIKVYFSLSQIPTNLDCLDDCFEEVKSANENSEIRKCVERLEGNTATSNDKDIDCLVFITKAVHVRESSGDRNLQQDNLLTEIVADRYPNFEIEGGRKRREVETQLVNTDRFDRLIPSEPLEMALSFCIMANLDARRRLPSLRFPKDEFYRGPQIWNGTDCSVFLPNFEEDLEKPKQTNDKPATTKLFGPASSTVGR